MKFDDSVVKYYLTFYKKIYQYDVGKYLQFLSKLSISELWWSDGVYYPKLLAL